MMFCLEKCVVFLFLYMFMSLTVQNVVSDEEPLCGNGRNFSKFCEDDYNLNVSLNKNILNKSVRINFRAEQARKKKCFYYFYVFLLQSNKYVMPKNLITLQNGIGSYDFKNLNSGSYQIQFHPCCLKVYTEESCPPNLAIAVNFTFPDSVASPQVKSASYLVPNQPSSIDSNVVITAVSIIVIISFLIVGMFCYKRLKLGVSDAIDDVIEKSSFPIASECEKIAKHVQVFILYSCNKESSRKVKILKDFLETCSYFNVVVIEEEMPYILIDPNSWLNDMLSYKCTNLGDHCNSDKKIIIIEPKNSIFYHGNKSQDELEHVIFCEAVNRLRFDWIRVLQDYCHLFIVCFDDDYPSTDELKNLVPRDRYSIPEHLIDLCLNLSTCDEVQFSVMKEKFVEHLQMHPIKDLGKQKF